MTNREIENKIKKAFINTVPDVFDTVLRGCEQQSEPMVAVVSQKRKSNIISLKKIVSIAAAIAIVFTAGLTGFFAAQFETVDSVISLDVNPSIELQVSKKDKIIDAVPLNDDAEKVLGNMDLEGSNLSVAVNAIIGSMLRNGYIDELSNSILISVDNKNQKKGEVLQKRLSDEISEILNNEDFDSEVISQTIKKNKEIAKLAEEYGITNGKAQLIKKIIEDNKKYKFNDLAPLTINQLNLILLGENIDIGEDATVTLKKYIGKSKAKKKALKDAELTADEIFDYKCEMDYSNKKMIYKITFKTDTDQYVYKINAVSGKIADSEKEQMFVGIIKGKEVSLERAGATEEEIKDYNYWFDGEYYYITFNIGLVKYRVEVDAVLGEVVSIKPNGQTNPNVTVSYINEADAKRVLMDELQTTEDEIFDYSCTLTKNGKIPVYELKCSKNYDIGIEKGVIYNTYIISALTGEVIGVGKDIVAQDDEQQNATNQNQGTESSAIGSESNDDTSQNSDLTEHQNGESSVVSEQDSHSQELNEDDKSSGGDSSLNSQGNNSIGNQNGESSGAGEQQSQAQTQNEQGNSQANNSAVTQSPEASGSVPVASTEGSQGHDLNESSKKEAIANNSKQGA